MVGTGLIDNFVMRGGFGPGLFVRRILYTQNHMTKYSLKWALAKKMFACKFNSYVVCTKRETKNLQSELSLQIHSRAHIKVKSLIKESDNGFQANRYYGIISWNAMHLKRVIDSKCLILLIGHIRCMGFSLRACKWPIFGGGHRRWQRRWLRQLWSQWRR